MTSPTPDPATTARLTWWGHATVSLTDAGTTLLTDPVLTDRVAHLRRRRGALLPPAAARVDGVLVSHLHADHLHLPSLRRVPHGVPVVVPRGSAAQVRGLARAGLELVEVSVGDEVRIGALTVTVLPAVHDGRRLPRGARSTAALGYLVEGSRRTYVAGDTALTDDMATWVPGCDLAVLPVGGWGPSLGPGHMDPAAAARAAALVGAGLAVPVHFGTLWPYGLQRVRPELFEPPGAEFVARAAEVGVRAVELVPGGSVEVPRVRT